MYKKKRGINYKILEKIRSFIAINLDSKIIEYLSSLTNDLNIGGESKIKWVKKNNLHITIKFLGYISPEQLDLINSGLKEIINQHNPFLIRLSPDIGIFPTYKIPRIIWVGIKEGANELKELYNSIEIILFKKGFPRENKVFSGHITIGRVKYIKDKNNLINFLKNMHVECLSQEVKSIDLMGSKLTPNGPIYNIIDKFPLLK